MRVGSLNTLVITTIEVATLLLNRIFNQQEGKTYIGSLVERFNVVTKDLDKMVDEFTGIPPPALLKNILICYLRLTELSRLYRCCDALKRCYALQLNFDSLVEVYTDLVSLPYDSKVE